MTISPLIELNDKAIAEAQKALSEYYARTDTQYAASVCVSAYLIEIERQRGNPTIKKIDP